jgi:formylglycine-generating enzyme required for sulfatase activity
MSWKKTSAILFFVLFCTPLLLRSAPEIHAQTLQQQRATLFDTLRKVHRLDDKQLAAVKAIFADSPVMGQGNPAITRHPFTPQQCRDRLHAAGVNHHDLGFETICGAKYMVPLYNPETENPEMARACIDQFEFPGIPCEYPVVWVRAREAAQICSAMGKRLCDAHEWEGACAGRLLAPDYPFDKVQGMSGADAVRTMRSLHNQRWSPEKRWSYGTTRKQGNCAMNSNKDPKCNGGDWKNCGSNTYPAGMFAGCDSDLGTYDMHGNAAEHMNLPTNDSEMASEGSKTLGHTEMKGSWFIWDKFPAHPDWCRWRAPYWHGTKVMSDHSHHNYHLSFRCCKSIP